MTLLGTWKRCKSCGQYWAELNTTGVCIYCSTSSQGNINRTWSVSTASMVLIQQSELDRLQTIESKYGTLLRWCNDIFSDEIVSELGYSASEMALFRIRKFLEAENG